MKNPTFVKNDFVFLKLLIIASILIGIAIVGLGIQSFFSRKKKFPDTHVGHNKAMKEKGITCAKCENMGSCSVNLPK